MQKYFQLSVIILNEQTTVHGPRFLQETTNFIQQTIRKLFTNGMENIFKNNITTDIAF